MELVSFGQIPCAIPQLTPTVYTAFLCDVHPMLHEYLMENHVCVAKIMRMANAWACLKSISENDLCHFTRRQMGSQGYAEFKCKRIEGSVGSQMSTN